MTVPDLGAQMRQQKAMNQLTAIMERIQWIENTLSEGPCFCSLTRVEEPGLAGQIVDKTCIRCILLGDPRGDNG